MNFKIFLNSSSPLRKSLFLLVVSALLYLIIYGENDLIKNISYSIIAAFIFDLFLNYDKERTLRQRSASHWVNEFNAIKFRGNIINAVIKYVHTIPFSGEAERFYNAIFKEQQSHVSKKDFKFVWYIDYSGIQYRPISVGDDLSVLLLEIITADVNFMVNINSYELIFETYPIMKIQVEEFLNISGRLLNIIHTKKGGHASIFASDEIIKQSIKEYLQKRKEFIESYSRIVAPNSV